MRIKLICQAEFVYKTVNVKTRNASIQLFSLFSFNIIFDFLCVNKNFKIILLTLNLEVSWNWRLQSHG